MSVPDPIKVGDVPEYSNFERWVKARENGKIAVINEFIRYLNFIISDIQLSSDEAEFIRNNIYLFAPRIIKLLNKHRSLFTDQNIGISVKEPFHQSCLLLGYILIRMLRTPSSLAEDYARKALIDIDVTLLEHDVIRIIIEIKEIKRESERINWWNHGLKKTRKSKQRFHKSRKLVR